MSEGFPTNSSEKKADSFGSKKELVVAYIKEQIGKKSKSLASIERGSDFRQESTRSVPLGPIPEEVLRDGGSDLSEWRAQTGHEKQEDSNEDPSQEIYEIDQEISALEIDLEYIESLEDYPKKHDEIDGDYDFRRFNSFVEEAEKSKG